jgi:hypothetical protein
MEVKLVSWLVDLKFCPWRRSPLGTGGPRVPFPEHAGPPACHRLGIHLVPGEGDDVQGEDGLCSESAPGPAACTGLPPPAHIARLLPAYAVLEAEAGCREEEGHARSSPNAAVRCSRGSWSVIAHRCQRPQHVRWIADEVIFSDDLFCNYASYISEAAMWNACIKSRWSHCAIRSKHMIWWIHTLRTWKCWMNPYGSFMYLKICWNAFAPNLKVPNILVWFSDVKWTCCDKRKKY